MQYSLLFRLFLMVCPLGPTWAKLSYIPCNESDVAIGNQASSLSSPINLIQFNSIQFNFESKCSPLADHQWAAATSAGHIGYAQLATVWCGLRE